MAKRFLLLFTLVLALLFPVSTDTVFGDVSVELEQAIRDTRSGNYEQAEAVYTRIVAEYPGTDDAFAAQRKLPCVYVALNRQPEAQASFAKMLDDFSTNDRLPHAVHEVVQGCHESGKADEGRQLCQIALGGRTVSDEAIWLQMGLAISDNYLGDDESVDSALEILKGEYAEDDRSAEALGQIAWSCRKLEKYGKAREIYQFVVDFWPNKDRAIFSKRGVVLSSISLGYYEEAWATLEELIGQYSEDEHAAEVISHVARSYGRLKQHEKARTVHQYVADNYSESELAIQSQTNAALSSIALRDDVGTQSSIDKLYGQFSRDPGIAQAVYFVARKLEDHDDERDMAGGANPYIIQEQPDNGFAASAGEKAEGLYRYITENHPNTNFGTLSRAKLGTVLIWRGDLDAAQSVLDTLLADLSGHDILPQAVSVLANGYYEVALSEESQAFDERTEWYYRKTVSECERIVNELPETANTTAEACYFAAVCRERLGEYASAIDYYQQVVDIWPDYKYVWHALFKIGRCYEELKQLGHIPEQETNEAIKAVYEQLLAEYPDCKVVPHTKSWLNSHNSI